MTSGNFSSALIESITIIRAERQRRELRDIEDLADSLQRSGLINPIVVTADFTLVAGERRLAAARSLGWTHITVQFAEDLDPLQLQLIELEENTRRTDLDWKDQCAAVARYHALRSSEKGWNRTRTAEALGVSPGLVTQYLDVDHELKQENEDVLAAPKFSVARGIIQRKQERAKASTLATLNPTEESSDDLPTPILHTDFIEWSKTYSGAPYNFIHCDFPYGIGADQHDQGNASARGGYADDIKTYYTLLEAFSNNLNNFCEESAHVMFWFSMEHYEFTFDALQAAGLKVLAHPLVWFKSDNSGILSDHRRQPRRVYETAFLCSRGDRYLVGPVANVFASPNVKSMHMSEKPRPVLAHFFRLFVDEFTRMLDPTCGSANALTVAEDMNASAVLGLEQDAGFYKLAVENYNG